MSAISPCPRCGRPVVVRSDVAREAQVRCPWCQAQYAQSAALDFSPPELILVSAAADTLPVSVDAPEETALEDLLFDPLEAHESPTLVAGENAPGLRDAAAAPLVDADPLELNEQHLRASAPAAAFTLDATPSKRPKRREPSALGTLISVVLAAPVGLALGYFILLWIGGKDKDFLQIGQKLPGWMLPASFSQAPAPAPVATGDNKSSAAKAANPQPARLASAAEPIKKKEGVDFKLNVPPLPDDVQPPNKLPSTDSAGAADSSAGDSTANSGDSEKPGTADETPAPDVPAGDANADDPFAEPAKKKSTDTPSSDTATDKPSTDDPAADPAAGDDPFAVKPLSTNPKDAATLAPDGASSEKPSPDKPAAEPDTPLDTTDVPPPPESPGPREKLNYRAIDLDQAMRTFEETQTELAQSKPADKDTLRKLRGQFYRRLYYLAEVATFAALPEQPVEAAAKRAEIETIVHKISGDSGRIREMGQAATQWLANPKQRGSVQGVLLAGDVEKIEPAGPLYATHIKLAAGGAAVTVLSAEKPALDVGHPGIVLGYIIERPAERIVGYKGELPSVVWSSMTFKPSSSTARAPGS